MSTLSQILHIGKESAVLLLIRSRGGVEQAAETYFGAHSASESASGSDSSSELVSRTTELYCVCVVRT